MTTPPLELSPTEVWLGHTHHQMPPLTGDAGTAERLLLLLHYGIDWADGWVSTRRATYWERLLPDRVLAATFNSPDLQRWWSTVAGELQSQPRIPAQRRELVTLLATTNTRPVLQHLRHDTTALVLRTRIVTEAIRETRQTQP